MNDAVTTTINAAAAAIIARILQPAATISQALATLPALTADAGIILNPSIELKTGAAPMDLNLNQLLNSAVLQSAIKSLPPELLARPQVIEALVLNNTLLPNASAEENPTSTALLASSKLLPVLEQATNYRVAVQWQNRILQLLSPQPLPTGKTVQLQINTRGELLLLPPALIAKTAPLSNPLLATPNQPKISAPLPDSPLQTLQQSLRETLPRQEALHTLVPMLQKFLAPATRAQLPAPIAKAVTQLLQSLPKATQVQTPEGLKRAIDNSGVFLESRIARAAAQPTAEAEPLPKIFTADIKAQITALLSIIRRALPNTPDMARAQPTPNENEEFVYSPKQILRNAQTIATNTENTESTDSLLNQLGKLLQSGLARIQLNQLDSAVSRHTNSDPQLLVPAWVLELPLQTQRGTDHLQLRIEQRRAQHENRTRIQWTVQIAFDLHELGKLAATLSIVEKNVAATLWAEQEHTHRTVQEHIVYLRAGLESIGVNVTEMQCRHGLPPPRAALISQQLVDVHT